MEVVLKQDVDKLGLRGEVVNVARGYARNFLLPRGLAEVGDARARQGAREARRAAGPPRRPDGRRGARARLAARGARAALRRHGRPDRLAVRLGHRDERRRPALGAGEAARRPPQARDGHDQADRPVHRPVRAVRRRDGAAEARGRSGGRGTAARGGARRARGAGARRRRRPPRPPCRPRSSTRTCPSLLRSPSKRPSRRRRPPPPSPPTAPSLPPRRNSHADSSTGSPRACGRRSTGCPQAPSGLWIWRQN